jgi:hypothetical protein
MTIIFVHGISVRAAGYEVAFRHIEAMLKSRRPDVKLAPCLWGHSFGAALKAGGVSIPRFAQTKGIDEELARVDEDVARWHCLVIDPLAELRLWALRPAVWNPSTPGAARRRALDCSSGLTGFGRLRLHFPFTHAPSEHGADRLGTRSRAECRDLACETGLAYVPWAFGVNRQS